MGKTVVEILTCDICRHESKPREITKKWVCWSRPHPMEDRSWIEQAICPDCIEDISGAINKVNTST